MTKDEIKNFYDLVVRMRIAQADAKNARRAGRYENTCQMLDKKARQLEKLVDEFIAKNSINDLLNSLNP